jgi:DNA-binding NarL/FixJ family response regulator
MKEGERRIRILLADDDLPMLAALQELLRPDFEIVDMVSDGSSLVASAFKFRPDLIVSDISMPKLNGIEAARQIHDSLPGIKFIFLTMHASIAYRKAASNLGASGYVLKSSAPEELAKSVREAFTTAL